MGFQSRLLSDGIGWSWHVPVRDALSRQTWNFWGLRFYYIRIGSLPTTYYHFTGTAAILQALALAGPMQLPLPLPLRLLVLQVLLLLLPARPSPCPGMAAEWGHLLFGSEAAGRQLAELFVASTAVVGGVVAPGGAIVFDRQ